MNSRPQLSETPMNTSMPTWIMRRTLTRSAMTPATPESSRNGTQWAMTAKPASAGEWNFWNSTQ